MMFSRIVITLLSLILAPATIGHAQTSATARSVDFDCWIGRDGPPYYTHYIRCIPDRDLPQPSMENKQVEALLETLHQQLHGPSGADAEKTMKSNMELVRESRSVWSIRIHSYPSDWSWEEGTPDRLVRAILCPADTPCTVMIRRE